MPIFTDYKRYPMYVSPLTERMRKRKAFADTELESKSNFFGIPAPSSVGNLSSAYSRLTLPTVPLNMHLSHVIDYNTIQQSMITNECDSTEYQSISPILSSTMDNYRLNTEYIATDTSPQRIRIIDDAKLSNMNRLNDDSLIYSSSTNEPNNQHCTNHKPKLSFSIESIIGIK